MDKIIIQGKTPLKGSVKISGSKNAALPILAASILANEPMVINQVPNLSDVKTMLRLLESFGIKSSFWGTKVKLDPRKVNKHLAHYDLVRTMRASILVLGPLLAKLGKAIVSLPGGCAIGARPVNLHLEALGKMGAEIKVEHGYIHAEVKKLQGAKIHFDQVTVTGTENILMAASLAKGVTEISNAAREPEVVDLANLLIAMGAKIFGAGESNIIVEGVEELGGCTHTVMPDRIEAGTFMIAAAMIKGSNIILENVDPVHVASLCERLELCGTKLDIHPHQIKLKASDEIKSVDATTSPYPGFPTDFQAQFMALMTLGSDVSVVEENIFENRFMHVSELSRMGANIKLQGNQAIVKGVKNLSGAPIMATDLRASASLVLAGLAAEGITEINRVYHIDRGYEQIEKKFRKLGAKIKRVNVKYRF